jgi:hypothetical protein
MSLIFYTAVQELAMETLAFFVLSAASSMKEKIAAGLKKTKNFAEKELLLHLW